MYIQGGSKRVVIRGSDPSLASGIDLYRGRVKTC